MASLLPFALFCLVAWEASRRTTDKVFCVITAACVTGVICVLITEGLSLGTLLYPGWLAFSWVICVIAMGLFSVRRRSVKVQANWKLDFGAGEQRWLAIGVLLILFTTLLMAIISPPATIDSLTYHMTRVMFWAKFHSCHHYLTEDSRQVCFPPFAEFWILHLQLLSGGDGLANLPQWLASAGSVVAIYGICRKLGGDSGASFYSAVWALTIPMCLLQASSTQNDLFMSFWLLSAIYFGLCWLETRATTTIGLAGLLAGLAALTKGTAYIILMPFALFALGYGARRKALAPALLAAALALSVNLPHFIRNQVVTGSPIGSTSVKIRETRAESFGLSCLLVGPLRQASLNLGLPKVADPVTRLLQRFHFTLGLDPNESSITFPNTEFIAKGWLRHEDGIGNPIDLVLGFFAVFAALQRPATRAGGYAILVFFAVGVFSVLLKWQPWGTRLQLPLFLTVCPLSGVCLRSMPVWPRRLLLGVKIGCAFFILGWNENRPMFSPSPQGGDHRNIFSLTRAQGYTVNCDVGAQAEYESALKFLSQESPQEVAISNLDYPYLLFVLGPHPNQFDWCYLQGEFAQSPNSFPKFLICKAETTNVTVQNVIYRKIWSGRLLSVLERNT